MKRKKEMSVQQTKYARFVCNDPPTDRANETSRAWLRLTHQSVNTSPNIISSHLSISGIPVLDQTTVLKEIKKRRSREYHCVENKGKEMSLLGSEARPDHRLWS